MSTDVSPGRWPELPFEPWEATGKTLHLWTQMVGKIRVAQTPWLNHSWHVTLHVSVRGLETPPIPCGGRDLQLEFDFIDHVLWLRVSDGQVRSVLLRPASVADFHGELVGALRTLGLPVRIDPMPNELADAIPFTRITSMPRTSASSRIDSGACS